MDYLHGHYQVEPWTVEQVLGGVAGAAGLALSEDGRTLYVSDLGNRRIWSVDADARELTAGGDSTQTEPEKIINVNDVLDELIEQSVQQVGKPVALMSKDDKVRAIRFLNESGAFLVTKSTDKVAKYFGISKYTLYSYIDANKK